MTPVHAPVLETALPEDQRGVAVGYQVWKNGGTSSKLLVLMVLLAAVTVIIVEVSLEAVHHIILSEPLDGLFAAGLKAAG